MKAAVEWINVLDKGTLIPTVLKSAYTLKISNALKFTGHWQI